MANYCDYEVRVKGRKKAGLMVYESMPCMDFKYVEWERDSDNLTTICFSGNCKWSVNYGVNDSLKCVDVDSMNEDEIEKNGSNYCEYSLRAKSEAFQCEIMVHYWSEESGFDQFDHYKNGEVLKQRKIEFDCNNQHKFDWDNLEFVGYEGEYDESIDGEQQNENIMEMFMKASDEYQEKPNDLTEKIYDLLNQLERLVDEEESDLDDGLIGETGFNMYNWTFTKGKTVKGNGWTIDIPDGFVQIDSNDVDTITGNKRLFELVPVTCKDEDDEYEIPIKILAGGSKDIQETEDNGMVHPNARAGKAGISGVTMAQVMTEIMGEAPRIFSIGWADVSAYIIVQDTSGGSYIYLCSVMTKNKNHIFRIQTQFVSDKQKTLLDVSVQEWLKTMRFDKPNKACPTKTKFEESACYDELLKGKTDKFEEAVKQARIEYLISLDGKIRILEFMCENDLIDENVEESIKEFLEDGMKVKLFFLEKADKIVEKLQNNKANSSLLETVMEKLADLDEDYLDFYLGEEKIEIELPKEVQAIRDRWKKIV